MKKKYAMKWVEALRSGKYEQGKYNLNRDEKYCCLGVLCEINGAPKETHTYVAPSGSKSIDTAYCGSETYLPDQIMKLTGMKTRAGGYIGTDGKGYTLANYNDGFAQHVDKPVNPKTFSEIADWIEKHYKVL